MPRESSACWYLLWQVRNRKFWGHNCYSRVDFWALGLDGEFRMNEHILIRARFDKGRIECARHSKLSSIWWFAPSLFPWGQSRRKVRWILEVTWAPKCFWLTTRFHDSVDALFLALSAFSRWKLYVRKLFLFFWWQRDLPARLLWKYLWRRQQHHRRLIRLDQWSQIWLGARSAIRAPSMNEFPSPCFLPLSIGLGD